MTMGEIVAERKIRMDAKDLPPSRTGAQQCGAPTQQTKRDRLTLVFLAIGKASGGAKSRIGADDWAMELGGSDAQYDDWCEHFWIAVADCGAAGAIESDRILRSVDWGGGDFGVLGRRGVVFSGGGRAVSLRTRGVRTVCGDSDWLAHLVVTHFRLLGGGESFHYISHCVCAGSESAAGSRRRVNGADRTFGGGELSRRYRWKMAEQLLYDHKGTTADSFRRGGTSGVVAASGDSRYSGGSAGARGRLVCGGAADGLCVRGI